LNEETFGPVVPLIRFREESDVVRQANDTPFGLAAYFYSRDIARIWRVADKLETGIVGINEGAVASEAAPFGGIKESGYGRERLTVRAQRVSAHQIPLPRSDSVTPTDHTAVARVPSGGNRFMWKKATKRAF